MKSKARRIIRGICNRGMLNWMPDELYLSIKYWACIGRRLHLKNPVTFNEKLQWLKLHDGNPAYALMVDKAEVKRFVSERIGPEHVIKTLGVWNSFDEIDFESMPNQFVLKCTHDSGGVVICRNKEEFDFAQAKAKITSGLRRNYYFVSRERPYSSVKPRIIAEEYISDLSNEALLDYKMFCFHGRVEMTVVWQDRFSSSGMKGCFYDRAWNLLDAKLAHYAVGTYRERPAAYEQMVACAEQLARDIPFVRVDFYEAAGKVLFGEMTFYPSSGFEPFESEKWDEKMGALLDCSKAAGRGR